MNRIAFWLVLLATSSCTISVRTSTPLAVDLTHVIPTFSADGVPLAGSKAVPTFGAQAVYETMLAYQAGQGHFYSGKLTLYDHHATHVDAPGHYVNDGASKEAETSDTRYVSQLTTADLIGPVVYLDISARVRAELAENKGRPSRDLTVTNFSNDSGNTVTPRDLDTVADKLRDGSWLVVNSGWSKFFSGGSLDQSDYINGWNFPGFSRSACDRLIEIEDERDIRINGIVMDNIGIDSGESSAPGDKPWHCHVRGLQRGWKFVENATNLSSLAAADPGSCTLVVGALKHAVGSGGTARVFAMCNE